MALCLARSVEAAWRRGCALSPWGSPLASAIGRRCMDRLRVEISRVRVGSRGRFARAAVCAGWARSRVARINADAGRCSADAQREVGVARWLQMRNRFPCRWARWSGGRAGFTAAELGEGAVERGFRRLAAVFHWLCRVSTWLCRVGTRLCGEGRKWGGVSKWQGRNAPCRFSAKTRVHSWRSLARQAGHVQCRLSIR